MAEQLSCKQQVVGSNPTASFSKYAKYLIEYNINLLMGGYPSGQRGQTVNLLAKPSEVRILLSPSFKPLVAQVLWCQVVALFGEEISNRRQIG